jgi:hypothetical protein
VNWAQVAADHVTAFNDAVARQDFDGFLARFDDEAVLRFENIPGAGNLEFAGRTCYEAAYRDRPPDDQIDVSGPVLVDAGSVVIPFRWRRDGGESTMRLTIGTGRVTRLVVTLRGSLKSGRQSADAGSAAPKRTQGLDSAIPSPIKCSIEQGRGAHCGGSVFL